LYSTNCHRQAPVAVNVVEFVNVTPYSADVKEVDPPLKLLVPIKFGNMPPPIAPLAWVATDPPLGVKVPLSELSVATVPADPVENEVTKDFAVFTDETVIVPADPTEPL
jgi:hypothetical protein